MTGNSACTLVAKPSAVPTSCAIASATCGTRVFIAAESFSSHARALRPASGSSVSNALRAAVDRAADVVRRPRGTRPTASSVDDETTSMVSRAERRLPGAVVIVLCRSESWKSSIYVMLSAGVCLMQHRTMASRQNFIVTGGASGLGRAAAEAIVAARRQRRSARRQRGGGQGRRAGDRRIRRASPRPT